MLMLMIMASALATAEISLSGVRLRGGGRCALGDEARFHVYHSGCVAVDGLGTQLEYAQLALFISLSVANVKFIPNRDQLISSHLPSYSGFAKDLGWPTQPTIGGVCQRACTRVPLDLMHVSTMFREASRAEAEEGGQTNDWSDMLTSENMPTFLEG